MLSSISWCVLTHRVFLHSTGGDAAWEEQILNCNGGGSSVVLASSASSNTWRVRGWNADDGNYVIPSTGRSPRKSLLIVVE